MISKAAAKAGYAHPPEPAPDRPDRKAKLEFSLRGKSVFDPMVRWRDDGHEAAFRAQWQNSPEGKEALARWHKRRVEDCPAYRRARRIAFQQWLGKSA